MMATTIQQIDTWRSASSEHQRLEFKEAKTQFDNRKLYKYCVALANEGGEHLLLGIEDQPPRKVVGTAAFHDPVEMATKIFHTLGFRVDIEEVTKTGVSSGNWGQWETGVSVQILTEIQRETGVRGNWGQGKLGSVGNWGQGNWGQCANLDRDSASISALDGAVKSNKELSDDAHTAGPHDESNPFCVDTELRSRPTRDHERPPEQR